MNAWEGVCTHYARRVGKCTKSKPRFLNQMISLINGASDDNHRFYISAIHGAFDAPLSGTLTALLLHVMPKSVNAAFL